MSAITQTHDLELKTLVNQFNMVCSEMLDLNMSHVPKWKMKVRALNMRKQKLLDSICETIKHVSPERKEQLKKDFYSKWSIILA